MALTFPVSSAFPIMLNVLTQPLAYSKVWRTVRWKTRVLIVPWSSEEYLDVFSYRPLECFTDVGNIVVDVNRVSKS